MIPTIEPPLVEISPRFEWVSREDIGLDSRSIGPITKRVLPCAFAEQKSRGPFSAQSDVLQERIDDIGKVLEEFRGHIDEVDDDGLMPPSAAAIKTAEALVFELSPLPQFVVPDGDGGITFEHRAGTSSARIRIDESGQAELFLYEAGRLVDLSGQLTNQTA